VAVVLGVLEQILLLGSLILFVGIVFLTATRGTNGLERALRVLSLFVGAMVVVGAQVAGLSFASFTVDALSNTHPSTALLSKVLGAALPGGIGVGFGWYLTRSLRRSHNIAMRVMAFVGMLAATQFLAIYVVATSRHGVRLGATALPNIFFVVGILLYMMLKYDPSRGRGGDASARPAMRHIQRFISTRVPRYSSFASPDADATSTVSTAFEEANRDLRRRMDPRSETARTDRERFGA
jgi:hypothetical protein